MDVLIWFLCSNMKRVGFCKSSLVDAAARKDAKKCLDISESLSRLGHEFQLITEAMCYFWGHGVVPRGILARRVALHPPDTVANFSKYFGPEDQVRLRAYLVEHPAPLDGASLRRKPSLLALLERYAPPPGEAASGLGGNSRKRKDGPPTGGMLVKKRSRQLGSISKGKTMVNPLPDKPVDSSPDVSASAALPLLSGLEEVLDQNSDPMMSSPLTALAEYGVGDPILEDAGSVQDLLARNGGAVEEDMNGNEVNAHE